MDVNDDQDYLSRRSLVEFRRRLAAKDPEMTLVRNVFDNIRDSAIKKLGLSARDQRLDSTHIISNIRTRGRLALFTNTLTVFLRSLSEEQFSRVPKAIRKWHQTEPEGWFGLGPAEQRDKLEQLAQYVYKLIVRFASDAQVKNTEPYQLLERLFREQCEIKKTPGPDGDSSKGNDIQGVEKGTGINI